MARQKISAVSVLFLCLLVDLNDCAKFGGGGGRSRGSSSHSYSVSRPAPRPPSYSHPPVYNRPSPHVGWNPPPANPSSYHKPNPAPAPTYGFNSHVTRPDQKQTVNPVGSGHTPNSPSAPPAGWTPGSNHGTSNQAINNHGTGNQRPIGWDVGGTQHAQNNQRPATVTHYPGSNAHPGGASNVGWNLPPRPGSAPSRPVGPPTTSHIQQSSYPQHQQTVYGGKTKIKVVNEVHNHYPGYYNIPQPHYQYPGYYNPPTYYHYSSSDTGSGALGFFLGYSLAKITTPTYSHYSFYDGYRPRYDHYTVVHYDHNRDQAPKDPVVQANSIVGCVGDSVTICPANTTSLCTTDGTLMCVASAFSTVPCTGNRQVSCVKSTVPCLNSTAPECRNSQTNNTQVSIPCVTTAQIYGDIKYVNNTIVQENPVNGTNATVGGSTNMTAGGSTNMTVGGGTNATAGRGTNATNPPTTTEEAITWYPPIATTPEPVATVPGRQKRDAPQNFCVTIVALPAKKKVTEGEEVYNGAKDLFSKFLVRAWGLA